MHSAAGAPPPDAAPARSASARAFSRTVCPYLAQKGPRRNSIRPRLNGGSDRKAGPFGARAGRPPASSQATALREALGERGPLSPRQFYAGLSCACATSACAFLKQRASLSPPGNNTVTVSRPHWKPPLRRKKTTGKFRINHF